MRKQLFYPSIYIINYYFPVKQYHCRSADSIFDRLVRQSHHGEAAFYQGRVSRSLPDRDRRGFLMPERRRRGGRKPEGCDPEQLPAALPVGEGPGMSDALSSGNMLQADMDAWLSAAGIDFAG